LFERLFVLRQLHAQMHPKAPKRVKGTRIRPSRHFKMGKAIRHASLDDCLNKFGRNRFDRSYQLRQSVQRCKDVPIRLQISVTEWNLSAIRCRDGLRASPQFAKFPEKIADSGSCRDYVVSL